MDYINPQKLLIQKNYKILLKVIWKDLKLCYDIGKTEPWLTFPNEGKFYLKIQYDM